MPKSAPLASSIVPFPLEADLIRNLRWSSVEQREIMLELSAASVRPFPAKLAYARRQRPPCMAAPRVRRQDFQNLLVPHPL